MPTYEYICDHCGDVSEKRQSIRDEPLRKCEKCGELALRRGVGGGSALHFKGSGFYITDYKGSSKGATSPSSNPVETSSAEVKEQCPCGKEDSSCSDKKSKDQK